MDNTKKAQWQRLTRTKVDPNQTATSVLLMNFRIIVFDADWSRILTLQTQSFSPHLNACPNLHNLYQNYSNGYFKVPSVETGTANTEFEVLTGMNLRYFFGPGEYPYKTYSKKHPTEVMTTAASLWIRNTCIT